MSRHPQSRCPCQVCHRDFPVSAVLPAALIRPSIVELIQHDYPDWSPEGFICSADLNRYRTKYVEAILVRERGELSDLEAEVVTSLREHELLSENVNQEFERELSFGARLSDRLAYFGGSWAFLICFGSFLALWVVVNSVLALLRPFDPYPFILLNLILSCLAAIQAPVILMSQNRQEAKDRLRAEHDYRVNLKAELEIRHLHAKLDMLLTNQWQRLLEIQEIQIELMEEFASHFKKK